MYVVYMLVRRKCTRCIHFGWTGLCRSTERPRLCSRCILRSVPPPLRSRIINSTDLWTRWISEKCRGIKDPLRVMQDERTVRPKHAPRMPAAAAEAREQTERGFYLQVSRCLKRSEGKEAPLYKTKRKEKDSYSLSRLMAKSWANWF